MVEFLHHEPGKFNVDWRPAVFLGVDIQNTEKIVGTADGIYRTQSIKRQAPGNRYDRAVLEGVMATPWAFK